MSLKKSLTMLLALVMLTMANAEKPIVKVDDWYYKQFDYRKAILFYERALKKDEKNTTKNLEMFFISC